MRVVLRFAFAALVACLASCSGDDPSAPPTASPTSRPSPAPSSTPSPSPLPSGTPLPPTSSPTPTATRTPTNLVGDIGPSDLDGFVYDATEGMSAPLEGATVDYRQYSNFRPGVRGSIATDAAGRFRFHIDLVHDTDAFVILVSLPRYEPIQVQHDGYEITYGGMSDLSFGLYPIGVPSPTPTSTPLPSATPTDMSEPATATSTPVGDFGERGVRGFVYDASHGPDVPLVGATVDYEQFSSVRQGRAGSVVTDASGHFIFVLDLHDTDNVVVRVAAPGYEPVDDQMLGYEIAYGEGDFFIGLHPLGVPSPTPTPSSPPTATTTPSPRGTIDVGGIVAQELSGEWYCPRITGAIVRFVSESSGEVFETTSEGGYYQIDVPRDDYAIQVRHPDYQPLDERLIGELIEDFPTYNFFLTRRTDGTPTPTPEPGELYFGYGGVVEEESSGIPVEGALIVFDHEHGLRREEVLSDEGGGYEVALDPGRYRTRVTHPEFETLEEDGFSVVCEPGGQTGNFFLRRLSTRSSPRREGPVDDRSERRWAEVEAVFARDLVRRSR